MARLSRPQRGDDTPNALETDETDAGTPSSGAPAADDAAGGRRGLPRTFESFRDREFRWFYLAMLGQMASINMQMVVRGYLAFVLTGSYAILGLVSLAGAAPMLALSVFGGVLADRLPKRTLLQAGQWASLANAAAMAALLFADLMTVGWLLASSVAQGMVMALTMPARQAMIPEVVGMERMMNAVSLNMAGMNGMRLFAPAAGGFIISLAGFEWAFVTMAALYGLAVVGLGRMTWQPAVAPAESGTGLIKMGMSGLQDIQDGLRYIRADRLMYVLLIFSFVTSVFGMPYQFLLPGYVADVFDGGGSEVGLLMSISAVGSLGGALALATFALHRRGAMLLAGTALLAVTLILFPVTDHYWIAAGVIVGVGVGEAMRMTLSQGMLQSYVDNAYRGRVMSVYMTQFSMMQFGTFVVGVIAEFTGIRVAIAGLGAALLVTTLVAAVAAPRLRRLD